MSFFSTTSCLQYCIRGTRNTTGDQVLKLRFGHCSRLISGFPHQILQQTPSTLIGEALFPLCLSDLEEAPFLAHFCVVEFLSSFNVHTSVADILFQKIASFAERLGGGVSIEARIDYVKMFWMEGQSIGEEGIVVVEETRRGAPESAIERLTNQEYEFEDEDEMEDCSVCYDEMKKGNGKEMAKMPCGHVYHKSCILTWLRTNNSCPLCRAKLQ